MEYPKMHTSKDYPKCSNGHIGIIDPRRAEIACRKCGMVLEKKLINSEFKRRAYSKEESQKRERVGPPTNVFKFNDGVYSTFNYDSDCNGKKLDAVTKHRFKRMSKLNLWSLTDTVEDRHLYDARKLFPLVASRLQICHNVRPFIMQNFKALVKKGLTANKSIDLSLAATTYLTLRQHNISIFQDEIADAFQVKGKNLYRCIAKFHLNYFCQMKRKISKPASLVRLAIIRYCNELELSYHIQKKALDIVEKAHKNPSLNGRNPKVLVAAAIYHACKICKELCTQKTIANVIGITTGGLRNVYRFLEKIYTA